MDKLIFKYSDGGRTFCTIFLSAFLSVKLGIGDWFISAVLLVGIYAFSACHGYSECKKELEGNHAETNRTN